MKNLTLTSSESKFDINTNSFNRSIPELIERINSDRLEILDLEIFISNKREEKKDLEISIEKIKFNAEKEVYNLDSFKNENQRKVAIKELLEDDKAYTSINDFIKELNRDINKYLEKIEYLKIYLKYFQDILEYKIILEKQKIPVNQT